MKRDKVIAEMKLRFRSGNDVPVERAYIRRDEWDALRLAPNRMTKQRKIDELLDENAKLQRALDIWTAAAVKRGEHIIATDTTGEGSMTQPMQPIYLDKHGAVRFKENAIVSYLLDKGGLTLNDLAKVEFPQEDREQFAQLIGRQRMVKRYECGSNGYTWCEGCYRMNEDESGDYVKADDYDALATRLAKAERTRASELAYVVEACKAASLGRATHESRDALLDLRAWATSRLTVNGATDSASGAQK